MNGLTDIVASRVLQHRGLIQAALGTVAIACALFLPDLALELSPESLVASDAHVQRAQSRLDAEFGRSEDPLLVIVETDDVLAEAPLSYQHLWARHLMELPWTERVDGLTVTPLPGWVRDDGASEPTLEDIEADDGLEAELVVGPQVEALARVAAAEPNRFPNGLVSVLGRHDAAGLVVEPIAAQRVGPAETAAVEIAVDALPLLTGSLVSEDRDLVVVAAVPRAGSDREQPMRDAHAFLANHPPPEGIAVRFGGLPHVRSELIGALRADQVWLALLAFGASFLVLLLGFRSAAGMVLPLASVGITLAIVVGAMSALGEPIDLLTNVVPALLITIGLGDSVHLLCRFRDELRRTDDDGSSKTARIEAARRTLRAIGPACFTTSVTTAVGFASLLFSDTPVLLRRFGAIAAIGVMVAYVVAVLFVPTAVVAFRSRNTHRAARPKGLSRAVDRFVLASARIAIRKPWLVVTAAGVVTLLSFALGKNVHADGSLLDQFADDHEVVTTTQLLEHQLSGVRTMEIGLFAQPGHFRTEEGLSTVDGVSQWLRERDGVLAVTSHGDWIRQTHRFVGGDRLTSDPELVSSLETLTDDGRGSLRGHLNDDASAARLVVRLEDRGVRDMMILLDDTDEALGGLAGVEAFVAGEAPLATHGLARVTSDLGTSLTLAIVVIFAILALLFRSPRLALLSVPPNLLPLAVTVAYMAVRDIPLHASTIIVFAVSLGLAVDGTIHVLCRYREEARRHAASATFRATVRSGRAVVLSAATLLLGFSSLLFSEFLPIRLFGELSLVAISAALVAELTLLPALLTLAERRNARISATEPVGATAAE